jgi:hypothetical protein
MFQPEVMCARVGWKMIIKKKKKKGKEMGEKRRRTGGVGHNIDL